MRRIAVATFARSDYGSCLPILRGIEAAPDLELRILAAAMHLAPEFGSTVREIEADGFEIDERIEMSLASDSAAASARSIGLGTLGFTDSLTRLAPDILLMVGDRFELLAAASAALTLRVPIAHVSGGEISEGAIDNQVRHAVTKLSHLHFVSTEEHAARLRQMGEEAWRVHVTGDPALDLLRQIERLDRSALGRRLRMELDVRPLIVITLHPTTLGTGSALGEVECLLRALSGAEGTLVFTAPNADAGGRQILAALRRFVAEHPRAALFANLGQLTYYSLLAEADLMVGNSSSGIWEAPSFRLPVINLGDRQAGRRRAGNVLDVAFEPEAISRALVKALDPRFRTRLADLINPYGDGRAAPRIVAALERVELGIGLLRKRFVDSPVGAGAIEEPVADLSAITE